MIGDVEDSDWFNGMEFLGTRQKSKRTFWKRKKIKMAESASESIPRVICLVLVLLDQRSSHYDKKDT